MGSVAWKTKPKNSPKAQYSNNKSSFTNKAGRTGTQQAVEAWRTRCLRCLLATTWTPTGVSSPPCLKQVTDFLTLTLLVWSPHPVRGNSVLPVAQPPKLSSCLCPLHQPLSAFPLASKCITGPPVAHPTPSNILLLGRTAAALCLVFSTAARGIEHLHRFEPSFRILGIQRKF